MEVEENSKANFQTKKKLFVKQIACGEAHTLALSYEGKVYSWGWAEDGQLGLDASKIKDGILSLKPFQITAGFDN